MGNNAEYCTGCVSDKKYPKEITAGDKYGHCTTNADDIDTYFRNKVALLFEKCHADCLKCIGGNNALLCSVCVDINTFPKEANPDDKYGPCAPYANGQRGWQVDLQQKLLRKCHLDCQTCQIGNDNTKCYICSDPAKFPKENLPGDVMGICQFFSAESPGGYYLDSNYKIIRHCHTDCLACFQSSSANRCI